MSQSNTEFDVEATLAKLAMKDKVRLLSGLGWWHTEPVPAAEVPSMRMSDGPNGIRGTRFFNGVPASCFPCSTGLGATFDVDFALQIGKALGDEARAKGCHIILAPTVNTQRSPLGGRGFESFAEDPHLNGSIAAAYINGVQSTGVSATIKHYVANDQEFERFSISSDVSERALREIFLKPFQIAIRDADPWALMTAYNRVNGVHVSEDKRLLDDILRKEWGYKGMVMSDWIGVYSTAESIKAGVDLEMPGPTVMRGKAVERSLIGGKLLPSDIDARVRKILQLLKHAHASGIPFSGPEESIDTPALRSLLRRAAASAVVLLKNNAKLLPLSTASGMKIAVIGPNAKHAMTSGGGSARLLCTYTVSPLEGITAAAKEFGGDVKYTLGTTGYKYLPLLDLLVKHGDKAGALVEFWNEEPSTDFVSPRPNFQTQLSKCAWSTGTRSLECTMLDGVDETKVNPTCYLRITTQFTPDESGDWELGLDIVGPGNLFLDQKLLIDLSSASPQSGGSEFGMGFASSQANIHVEKGKTYALELRRGLVDFAALGSPFACWGRVRIGGKKAVKDEDALAEAVRLAKESDVAIVVVGLNYDWESEGFDRPDMELPGITSRLVSEVLRANPKTVVVNQSGTPVTLPWIQEADTVLQAFYGGNELGSGLADVLWGKVNPSAKLPLSWPKRLEDNPSYPSFGSKGQEHGKIMYNEGIFVGYRGYEIRDLAPLFPFGHGLSYSQFAYSSLDVSSVSPAPSLQFTVSFTITNTSDIQGAEIAQVYISDAQSSLPRPVKELKGFAKAELQAGESKTFKVTLGRDALSFWDDRMSSWVAEKGIFKVIVAASSAKEDVKLSEELELKDTVHWTGL